MTGLQNGVNKTSLAPAQDNQYSGQKLEAMKKPCMQYIFSFTLDRSKIATATNIFSDTDIPHGFILMLIWSK